MDNDKSHAAIMERYNRANMLAIVIHNGTLFACVADVLYLLRENERLNKLLSGETNMLSDTIEKLEEKKE